MKEKIRLIIALTGYLSLFGCSGGSSTSTNQNLPFGITNLKLNLTGTTNCSVDSGSPVINCNITQPPIVNHLTINYDNSRVTPAYVYMPESGIEKYGLNINADGSCPQSAESGSYVCNLALSSGTLLKTGTIYLVAKQASGKEANLITINLNDH